MAMKFLLEMASNKYYLLNIKISKKRVGDFSTLRVYSGDASVNARMGEWQFSNFFRIFHEI